MRSFASTLGFYPVDPVSGNYVLGPFIESATVPLGNGRELKIEAKRQSAAPVYVQSVWLNGKSQHRTWSEHADIAEGGSLVFQMDTQPDPHFGTHGELPSLMTL